ncbi:hypothetical protein [Nitrogeniibacter aestuarii]|uniref:hypothetical protein n=1 Tax=Nitrogeniibacter aestuarii TaxID=2815343 RepID=UPI001D126E46|nr:hypothetical protein [Nitrogeniibacter aestuarii]
MKPIARLLALPFLAAIAFLGYAYGSLYFAGYLFPRVVPRPYVEMLSAAAVGSLVAGMLVALPLLKLFPTRYPLAALVVASPFMVIRGSDLAHYLGKNETRIVVMSVSEFVIYPAGIILLCWLASRFLPQLRHEA